MDILKLAHYCKLTAEKYPVYKDKFQITESMFSDQLTGISSIDKLNFNAKRIYN